MKEFKSIVIPEEILIVENSSGQGFVVDPNNEKVLETAKNWARGFVYGEGNTWEERRANGYEWEPIINRYANGLFKLNLNSSAGNSWNGGKLSFWDCNIIAPDDKNYLIGINQELLLNLLLNCTMINGEVQETIWLGRQKGNTGAYTENMEDFQQAKEEILQRQANLKKTKKYSPGDLVGSLTKKYIYLGEFEKKQCIYCNYDYYDYNTRKVGMIKCSEKKHLYLELNNHYGHCLEERDFKSSYTIYEEKHSDITLDAYKEMVLKESKYYSEVQEVLQYYEVSIEEVIAKLGEKSSYKFVRG